jgi:hypothetical protein
VYGNAVYVAMHTVIETPTFLHDCSNLAEDERLAIVAEIAANPQLGDLLKGTGGARKRRFPGRSKGKSGGYRTVAYYAADDVPVLLLALIDKGDRADLSKAEQNELRKELVGYAADYRTGVRRRIVEMRRRKS